MADHNHHRCHQHPPSPCLLLGPSIVVRSSSSLPHFPLRSLSPPPSRSSSYLHRILFDCCVLSVFIFVRHHVISLLLLKILTSASATLLNPRHHLPTLSALALSSIWLLRASVTDSTDALSPPSSHHKRSVKSLLSLSPSLPLLLLSQLRCPLCQRRPSPPLLPLLLSSLLPRRRGQRPSAALHSPSLSSYLSRSSGSSPRWRRHRPTLKDLRPQ